jgi:phage terminase large subunit-like protein
MKSLTLDDQTRVPFGRLILASIGLAAVLLSGCTNRQGQDMRLSHGDWEIVYDKAIRADGSLFFPERLTKEFLEEQRKTLGSYIFTNQYLNEIIPDGERTLKKEWLSYYKQLPEYKTTFAFIDPAISQENDSDFTALAVVDVDVEGKWFLKVARRAKLTVTQQLNLVFIVHQKFKPNIIGIEDVAYQRALVQLVDEEMRRRQTVIPVMPVKRGPDKTKNMRIEALVPRFEWNRILIAQGLYDFESEYLKFPRAAHKDILDALASIEDIYYAPPRIKEAQRDPAPNEPGYEKWYIEQLAKRKG